MDAPFLVPRGIYSWHAPFWMRAILLPLPKSERRGALEAIAACMNASFSNGRPARNWHVEDIHWPEEPDCLARRLGCRLAADIDVTGFVDLVKAGIGPAYAGKISVAPLEAKLRYDELGLGTIEYSLELTAANMADWTAFLCDQAMWQALNMRVIEEGDALALVVQWPAMRAAMAAAIGERRLPELENLWGDVADFPHDRTNYSGVGLTLFSTGLNASDEEAALAFMREVATARAGAIDDPANTWICRRQTRAGTLEILSKGMAPAALISEPATGTGELPSARCRALWRQVFMHYAALDEATYGLREVVARAISVERTGYSSIQAEQTYDALRRSVGGIALIRDAAYPNKFAADDFEGEVFGSMASAWSFADADMVLEKLLEDADRATTRANELAERVQERRLAMFLAFLTLLTIISVLQDFSQFIGAKGLEELTFGLWTRVLILVASVGGALLGLGAVFGLMTRKRKAGR